MSRVYKILMVAMVVSRALFGAEPDARPNILFLLADDMRFDAMGCAGHPLVQTPSLDALARDGVRFTQAFAQSPMCGPSRMTLLTGLTQRSHGGARPFVIRRADALNSYPAQLKAVGYRTALIGKHHFELEKGMAPKVMFDVDRSITRPYLRTDRHTEDRIMDEALGFLDSQPNDRPFCLSVSFNFVHAEDSKHDTAYDHYPWTGNVEDSLYAAADVPVPRLGNPQVFDGLPEFIRNSLGRTRWQWRWTPEKYPDYMRAYLRCITAMDSMVGELRDKLAQMGVEKNTVIIFAADNGYFMGDRGLAGKWSHFNESVHIPLMICDPRRPAAARGQPADELVSLVDIAPTLLDYGGVDAPETVQGQSLRPVVEGGSLSVARDAVYLEHLLRLKPIPKWRGVRTKRYVYADYFEDGYEFLHDLKTDPDQLINLAGNPEYQSVLATMRKRTKEFQAEYPDHTGL